MSPQAPEREAERFRLAQEVLTWPRDGVRISWHGQFLRNLAGVLLNWGERAPAEIVVRELQQLAQRTQDADLQLRLLAQEAMVATIDGRLEAAAEAGATLGPFAVEAITRTLILLGRTGEALRIVEDMNTAAGGPTEEPSMAYLGERVMCLANAGQSLEAAVLVRRLAVEFDITNPEGRPAVPVLALLLESAVLVGDREIAAQLMIRLAVLAGVIHTSWTNSCIGRHLGAGAMMLDRLEEARHYYAQALGIATKIRHRPEIALIRLGLAELDAAEGHSDAAREHLAFCIPEFEAMKMRPGLERALALKERLGNGV